MLPMKMHNPPHPGEILKEEYVIPLNLSIRETSAALKISRKGLSSIVNGHTGISPTMAIKLAKVLTTTPELWLNLQEQYDLWNARKTVDLSGIKRLYRAAA